MKKIFILTLFTLSSLCAFSQHNFFRYYNSRYKRHYYTTNFDEYGGGHDGWQLEGSACMVFTAEYKQGGVVPLFRYYNPTGKDHYYTTNFSELGRGARGYNLEGPACYIYRFRARGTTPLFKYYNAAVGDHFYTIDKEELGRGGFDGYQFQGVAGYVYQGNDSH